jgi:hypothetical protein
MATSFSANRLVYKNVCVKSTLHFSQALPSYRTGIGKGVKSALGSNAFIFSAKPPSHHVAKPTAPAYLHVSRQTRYVNLTVNGARFIFLTRPALVAQDKLTDPAYHSPAGPITPLDILYGHGAALAAGHHYMAHKCGFTLKSLTLALQDAGFQTMAGKRRLHAFSLWMIACKSVVDEAEIRKLAGEYLPK